MINLSNFDQTSYAGNVTHLAEPVIDQFGNILGHMISSSTYQEGETRILNVVFVPAKKEEE